MKLSEALRFQSPELRHTTGVLFRMEREVGVGYGMPTVLCACALGYAALGAGLITLEQARKRARGDWDADDAKAVYHVDERLEQIYDVTDEAMNKVAKERFGLCSVGRVRILSLVVMLNDEAGLTPGAIADFLAEFGY